MKVCGGNSHDRVCKELGRCLSAALSIIRSPMKAFGRRSCLGSSCHENHVCSRGMVIFQSPKASRFAFNRVRAAEHDEYNYY